MNISKLDFEMQKFNEENVEILLNNLKLDTKNFFIAITKPSLLASTIMGSISEFLNRYCIINFSKTELNLILLSRKNSKKATELIKLNYNEIHKIKLSNVFVSYMLKINLNETSMNFQIFKKVEKFTKSKTKASINLFKNIYNL